MCKEFNDKMNDDKKSKITALDSVIALADRNDVKTAADVIEIINIYKEALEEQVKGEQ